MRRAGMVLLEVFFALACFAAGAGVAVLLARLLG